MVRPVSLLDRGRETIKVFHEIEYQDSDGNTMTGPSPTGEKVSNVSIQATAQSGTSARRAELMAEGFETEQVMRLRFPRSYKKVLGAQAQIEWKGDRYSVHGDALYFNGSPRTAHRFYSIRRS